MTVYYKCLSQYNSKLYSFMREYNEKYSLEYKVGEEVYPIIGKLYVFNTFDDAVEFLVSNFCESIGETLRLFSCYADIFDTEDIMIADNFYSCDIESFWRRRGGIYLHAPKGTLLANSVKLIERIPVRIDGHRR